MTSDATLPSNERCGVDGCVLDKGHPGSVHNTTTALVEIARACAVDLRRVGRPTAADGVEAIAKEVQRLRDERERGTTALRAAFGEELWALGHPAYVVNHLRKEYAKLERLWKQACVDRDAHETSEPRCTVCSAPLTVSVVCSDRCARRANELKANTQKANSVACVWRSGCRNPRLCGEMGCCQQLGADKASESPKVT